MIHSGILVASLWRVFPITQTSHPDMPSLTTVTLPNAFSFKFKNVTIRGSCLSCSPSYIDIGAFEEIALPAVSSPSKNKSCCNVYCSSFFKTRRFLHVFIAFYGTYRRTTFPLISSQHQTDSPSCHYNSSLNIPSCNKQARE